MKIVNDRHHFSHVGRFFLHVIARYPLARWTLLLTFVLLVLEYASLSLMLPLSMGATATSTGHASVTIWSGVARQLGLKPELMTWVWLFLVLLALRSIAGYIHLCLTTMVSKQVHREMSKNVFGQIVVDEPMTDIYRRTVGFYVSLAGDDTFRAGTLINSALLFLAAVVSVAAGLVLLFLFSAAAFEVTMAFLLVSAVGVAFCARMLLRLNGRAVEVSRETHTTFLEALNSLRSIRSMGSEVFVFRNYAEQMRVYTRLLFLVEAFKSGIRFFPGVVALAVGIVVLAPWRAGQLSFEASVIFAATTILIRVFLSLGALLAAGGALLIDGRAAKDLGTLIEINRSAAVELQPALAPTLHHDTVMERIDLIGLHYAYDGRRDVLRNVSLTLRRGRSYSIVGPSGTGKSTLADILLGLVPPSAGEIRINGQAARAADLRSRVILVEQQPRIFSVSVRENLTLGLDVDAAALNQALDAVEMTSFVNDLPLGLETTLDYQGANLSGGQRQRLALARALLRRPDVLILDEATSALDAATEELVIRSVRRAMHDGILIFITHDLDLAAAADEIINLKPRASDAERSAA
jgi:ABC-type multidrug transport system fused ATPase/permease subunit